MKGVVNSNSTRLAVWLNFLRWVESTDMLDHQKFESSVETEQPSIGHWDAKLALLQTKLTKIIGSFLSRYRLFRQFSF
jgi:hypothetical protein